MDYMANFAYYKIEETGCSDTTFNSNDLVYLTGLSYL